MIWRRNIRRTGSDPCRSRRSASLCRRAWRETRRSRPKTDRRSNAPSPAPQAHPSLCGSPPFGRHQHPDRAGRDQHSAAHAFERRTARKTVSISRLSMPPSTRTVMAPITISIKLGRRCAAFFAGADSTATTGTDVGISSAGRAKSPVLAVLNACSPSGWRAASSAGRASRTA